MIDDSDAGVCRTSVNTGTNNRTQHSENVKFIVNSLGLICSLSAGIKTNGAPARVGYFQGFLGQLKRH